MRDVDTDTCSCHLIHGLHSLECQKAYDEEVAYHALNDADSPLQKEINATNASLEARVGEGKDATRYTRRWSNPR